MAQVVAFAEVVGREEISRGLPTIGRPLGEYVAGSNNRSECRVPIPKVDQERLRKLSRMTGEKSFEQLAEAGFVNVSIGDIRHLDAATLVRVGYSISYDGDEAEQLQIYDPHFGK
ncbi:MAG: hypothetical protein ACT4RN_22505 [Pseudonocardia sp.]